jgi:tetratricopeptide (TPR) repeat protein
MWATDGVKPDASELPTAGPFVGKLAAIPDEPAFAGRVRMAPGDAASFDPSRVRGVDDDDDVLPARRGSRAGMWVLLMALAVMGGAAVGVYLFVLRDGRDEQAAHAVKDAGVVVAATPDAAQVVAPAADAAAAEAVAPIAAARAGLGADLEPWLRTSMQGLDAQPDAPSQALRAHLTAQLAQDLIDRAGLIASPEADNLRKDAKQLVLDAATAAQRALRAAGDDPGANIAMAEVLRLQGKPARDISRYLETAKARPDKNWAVELALADAMLLARDGKLDEARAAFAAIDQGDGKLETAGDVRARFHLALVLAAQGKAADARPLVDAILAAQPEHTGARALSGKLETLVAKTDPLPPEDGNKDGSKDAGKAPPPRTNPPRTGGTPPPPPTTPPSSGGPDTYDRLVARANAVADTSCAKAMDLYSKALEQKPNGVEALAGLGYCQIDAKQFSSAFSKFRAALAVSPRYEPALRGVAETYQQMGRKEQAIEAYKAYLEIYPDSVAARKQLERLGGDAGAHPPAGSAAPPATPPSAPSSPPASAPANPPPANPPPANPPAQPAPSGDSAGAGSGSG